MRVGVNTLTIRPDHGGGIERYLRAVLAKMRGIQAETEFLIFTDPTNDDSFDGWERACLRGGVTQLDAAVRRAGVDVLFSPLATAPAKSSAPTVLFALDLYDWEARSVRQRRGMAAKLKAARKLCASAAALIAPSKFVQRTFLEVLGVPLNKVVVAPLGVDEGFARPRACIVESPFLLTVGCTREFKNIPRLMEAFAQLHEEIPHNLVVVGRPAEAEPDDWGPRVVRIDRCPAETLAGLYQHCDVFIQPSLYEGSGVTVLEAMRAGAPVVTSRTGGIPEVAGDVPIFFNPESTHSLMAAIRRAIAEYPNERLNRTNSGRRCAAEYTWEACAWKTLSAFRRA